MHVEKPRGVLLHTKQLIKAMLKFDPRLSRRAEDAKKLAVISQRGPVNRGKKQMFRHEALFP